MIEKRKDMNNLTFPTRHLFSFLTMSLFISSSLADQMLRAEHQKELETLGVQQEFVLEGDVKVFWEESCMISGCYDCGCHIDIRATVVENRIYMDSAIGMCKPSGACARCIPCTGSTILRDLPRGKYKVFSPKYSSLPNLIRIP
jgi:hypothetical protein